MASKRNAGGNSGQIERVDRISNLPAEILAHIFSFLPTKDVVAASILSRTYKFLWTQVPVIDMGEHVYYHDEKRIQFQNFVNNVLLLNKEPSLRFCRLTVPFNMDSLYANAWIEAIARREVKAMHLNLCCNAKLRFCVLEKLVFLMLKVLPDLDMATLHLPNLRVLKLINVMDLNVGSPLMSFASSCPVLQEFVINECTLSEDSEENLRVCSSTLKRLEIQDMSDVYVVVIDAPNLEYLMISDGYSTLYYASDLSSLREADMFISVLCYGEPDPHFRTNSLKFIGSLTSSSTLRLRMTRFQFEDIRDRVYDQLPTFSNLSCLELEIWDSCRCIVPAILEHTPKLVNLIVTCTPSDGDFDFVRESKCSHETQAPSCLLDSIKSIKIKDFDDSEESAEIVRYLLMNARVLDEMNIECCFKLSPVDEMVIIRELLSFTRGSPTSKVSLSES